MSEEEEVTQKKLLLIPFAKWKLFFFLRASRRKERMLLILKHSRSKAEKRRQFYPFFSWASSLPFRFYYIFRCLSLTYSLNLLTVPFIAYYKMQNKSKKKMKLNQHRRNYRKILFLTFSFWLYQIRLDLTIFFRGCGGLHKK